MNNITVCICANANNNGDCLSLPLISNGNDYAKMLFVLIPGIFGLILGGWCIVRRRIANKNKTKPKPNRKIYRQVDDNTEIELLKL